ncbi:protein HEG homolog 1 [Carlito syrichta]|uniref:Protein HEG homolog 1 n=1 Tax=Carlito syrichta TaxID=1868482 RepID=A0A3Q0DJT4_CARSF|nr:protein HEG homolog 1 [Carlito syrichta]
MEEIPVNSGSREVTRKGAPGAVKEDEHIQTHRATAKESHWLESNTEPHKENITFHQSQEDFSTMASKEGVMVETSGKSHASSNAPENCTLLTETADAGGRNDSSSRTNFTISPVGHSLEIATALNSQSSTLALESLPLPSSGSGSEGRTASFQAKSGTSQGSPERRTGLSGEVTVHTQVAATSALSQSSLPALEMGEPTTLSRKRASSGPELSSLHVLRTPAYAALSDHSSSSERVELLNNSTGLQGSSVSQTKNTHVATTFTDGAPRMLRSLTVSLEPINETEVFPEDSKIATTSASAHSSPSAVESRRNSGITRNPATGEFIEPSTENEFGLTSLHWQNDSPTFREHQLASSLEAENGSSVSQTETVSRPVPSTQSGESTPHWFLTNSETFAEVAGSSASYSEVVNTSVLTQFSDPAPQPGGSNTALGDRIYSESSFTSSSESLDSSVPRGERSITGTSYGQVSGTDPERRTSSHHTDHTYVSSTFTKGERALLSITDNNSSSDITESSTSYIKISNSSHSDYSSSSHAQTERSSISSYDGEYAQPSTESLVLHTSNLLPYTPTVNMPNTAVVLDTDTGSVGDSSSSSVPPLPLSSVSQSHQLFSSTQPSTRTSMNLLKSTSDASIPLSSSPSPLSVSLTASTPTSLSVSQATLPHSSPSPVLSRERETPVTSVWLSTMASSMAMFRSSQTADPENQSTPHHKKIITESKSPSLVLLPTASTKAITMGSPAEVSFPPSSKESFTEQTLPTTSTSLAQMPPALMTTTLETPHPPVITPSIPSSTASRITDPVAVETTTGKQLLPTHPDILGPQISTEGAVSTKRNQVHIDTTTRLIPLTSVSTSAKELTTRLGIAKEYSPTSHFLRTSPSPQTTDVPTTETLTPESATFAVQNSTQSTTTSSSSTSVSSCAMNPCLHDGKCIEDPTHRGYHCVCLPSWQGDDCSVDVNECLSNPCPPLAMCNNTQGSFLCKCPVGYQMEKGICNLVRTFVTEFKLKRTFLNTTAEKPSDLLEVENDITKTLNVCFSVLPGYIRSTVFASRESGVVVISLQTTFSLASNVTLFDLADRIQKCVNSCRSSAEACQYLGSHRRIFRAGSLCKRKSPECDKETSICTDLDGVALCQCKSGYFQFNKMDHSCRACEDGYRLENETCMSCPFGLGGLNCGNPYQLITVVIAAAGGGLLLILGIALIVTCCRKNKNDISKLIFKSGDFQMSPYAEYPKNPRSQEWGREAIEMHENGSTKNLLQMTDVYYSPSGVRNPELERNGLYPAYTGLPGSRHSCIFPGQYNPSFIGDESRRRDYF